MDIHLNLTVLLYYQWITFKWLLDDGKGKNMPNEHAQLSI